MAAAATRGAHVASARTARAVVAVLSIGLLLVVAGCGGDGNDPTPRAPAGDLRDLEHETLNKATKAQIERFAEIRIPASATNLRSSSRSAMDTQVLVSFRLPRKDLDAFVRSGNFRSTLVENNRAIVSGTGAKLGWQLEKAKRITGLRDVKPGLGRNLLIVLDESQRPAIYLEAASL
jgi:hypothetical protein